MLIPDMTNLGLFLRFHYAGWTLQTCEIYPVTSRLSSKRFRLVDAGVRVASAMRAAPNTKHVSCLMNVFGKISHHSDEDCTGARRHIA